MAPDSYREQKPLTMLRMSGQIHDNFAKAGIPIGFVSVAGTVRVEQGLIISNSCKRPIDIYDELMQLIRKN